MNRSGEVLIVTGAPGAGKTTVAALVASGNAGPAVHLHADDFWHYIKTGWIAPYLPEVSLATTLRRAQQRATPGLTDAAPITSLYEQWDDLGADLHGHVLDNTDSTPGQTAEQIRALLRSGALRLERSTAR